MSGITRRKFIQRGAMASGAILFASPYDFSALGHPGSDPKKITISRVSSFSESGGNAIK